MSINIETVAEKTFNVLKGFGFEVRSFNKDGDQVINPKEATRFAVAEPNLLARLDVKEKAILLATSQDLSESPVRDMLKELAQDYLMSFDYKIFDKKIKPKGEKVDIKRNAETDMADVMEELNLLKRLSGIDIREDEEDDNFVYASEIVFFDKDGKEIGYMDWDGYDDANSGHSEQELQAIAQKYNISSADGKVVGYFDASEDEIEFSDPHNDETYPEGTTGVYIDTHSKEESIEELNLLKRLSGIEENTKDPQPEGDDCLDCENGVADDGTLCKTCDGDGVDDGYFGGTKAYENDVEEADYSKQRPRPDNAEFNKVSPARKEIMDQYGLAGEKLFDIAWDKTIEQLGSKGTVRAAVSATYIRAKELGLPQVGGQKVDLSDVKGSDVMYRPQDDKISSTIGNFASDNRDPRKNFESVNLSDITLDMITEASLGKMTGSRKSSYQPLADNVKIIVRHNKDVNEEVRGARSRNIHSILIQRGEEKFKMAENNLQAARAMARHLHNGGETFDTTGEAITEMSRDYSKLREFVRYVRKAKLVNETNEEFVTLAIENINDIKTNLKKLSGVKSYANAVETVTNYNNVEMLQDDLDLENKFTETHFDDKVANVLDNLKVMASKRHAFESYITNAIANETFENIKDQLKEDELMEFDTPHAKLGHQVSRLGYSAKDEKLGNYLHSISNKLNAGGQLSQFEYGAIKSSLLSAGQHNVQSQSAPMTATESYEAFLDQFIIL